jgi:hypothetical protein
LQINDTVDRPHEVKAVASPQHCLWTDRRNRGVAAVDGGQEEARQVSQIRVCNTFPVDRSAGLDDHLDAEAASLLLHLRPSRTAVRQDARREQDQRDEADQGDGEP